LPRLVSFVVMVITPCDTKTFLFKDKHSVFIFRFSEAKFRKKLFYNYYPDTEQAVGETNGEGSGLSKREILRCAQNDVNRFEILISTQIGIYLSGLSTRPINRMLPEWLSRITNTKGWSALKTGVCVGPADVVFIITPVAAAASVPSSLTST